MKTLAFKIACVLDECCVWSRRLWLIIRHRPFLTCPLCKGRGGAVSGYYEPEWSECYCWDHWKDLEDCGLKWFVGRTPAWRWLQAKLSIRFGCVYPARVRDVIRCRIGLHRWMHEEDGTLGPGGKVCCVCYHHREVESAGGAEAVCDDQAEAADA